jgi:hypothetical protein
MVPAPMLPAVNTVRREKIGTGIPEFLLSLPQARGGGSSWP